LDQDEVDELKTCAKDEPDGEKEGGERAEVKGKEVEVDSS